MRQDAAAQQLMRDLRVLAAAEALLNAFESGPATADALVLVSRHAVSAADTAHALLQALRQQENRSGDWWGGDG